MKGWEFSLNLCNSFREDRETIKTGVGRGGLIVVIFNAISEGRGRWVKIWVTESNWIPTSTIALYIVVTLKIRTNIYDRNYIFIVWITYIFRSIIFTFKTGIEIIATPPITANN